MDITPRPVLDELEFDLLNLGDSTEELLNRRAEENYVYVNSAQIGSSTFLVFKKRQSDPR